MKNKVDTRRDEPAEIPTFVLCKQIGAKQRNTVLLITVCKTKDLITNFWREDLPAALTDPNGSAGPAGGPPAIIRVDRNDRGQLVLSAVLPASPL